MSNYCCSCSCFFSKHTCISHWSFLIFRLATLFQNFRLSLRFSRRFLLYLSFCSSARGSIQCVMCVLLAWRARYTTLLILLHCRGPTAVRLFGLCSVLEFESSNSRTPRSKGPRSSHSGRRPFLSCGGGRQSNIHVYLVVTYTPAEPSTVPETILLLHSIH
jgi:hypothetical protein